MVVHEMPVKVVAYGISDIGLVRQNNEDVFLEMPEQRFFILADGMGGHQAGEVAAKEATNALSEAFKKTFKKGSKGLKNLVDAKHYIEKGIKHANSVVYKMSRLHEALRGMGTTICCIYFHELGAIIGHVGDSRIYRLRDKELIQITEDHSLLRELVDLGQLSKQQAVDFIYKNIITKAIGTEPSIEPTVNLMDVQQGDKYLMATDGLTDLLPSEEIEFIINAIPDIKIAAQKLVEEAKRKGGHDNITLILIEVVNVQ